MARPWNFEIRLKTFRNAIITLKKTKPVSVSKVSLLILMCLHFPNFSVIESVYYGIGYRTKCNTVNERCHATDEA
jgi:hypothetical protein